MRLTAGSARTCCQAVFVLTVLVVFSVAEHASDAAAECCPAAAIPLPKAQTRPKRMSFLIGAQKSGTTFLFEELTSRHPHIYPKDKPTVEGIRGRLNIKEPHFFDMVPINYFQGYLRRYESKADSGSAPIVYLDGTPDYLHTASAACRVASAFPDAKLLVILKDPVQRALSHWNMIMHASEGHGRFVKSNFTKEVYRELEALRADGCSFEPSMASQQPAAASTLHKTSDSAGILAFTDSSSRLLLDPGAASGGSNSSWSRYPGLKSWNECFKCIFMDCGDFSGPIVTKDQFKKVKKDICKFHYPRAGVLRRGLYVYQLEWWLRFFPPEQIMVINYGEVQQDAEAVTDRVIEFLGLDVKLKKKPKPGVKTGFELPAKFYKVGEHKRTFEELYMFYQHANAELYRLMKSIGPSSGWRGTFPSTYSEDIE